MDNINFLDLDEFGIDILNEINIIYYQKLNLLGITNINCEVRIKNLIFNSNNSCKLIIKNACVSNNTDGLNLFIESLLEVLLKLPNSTRNNILEKLGMTIEDLQNKNNVGLISKCSVHSSVDNLISIDSFFIPQCSSSNLKYKSMFLFVNSGSANSNCAQMELTSALKFDHKEEKKDISIDKLFGIDIEYYFYIFLYISLISIFIVLVNLRTKKGRKIFFYRNDFGNWVEGFYLRPPVKSFVKDD